MLFTELCNTKQTAQIEGKNAVCLDGGLVWPLAHGVSAQVCMIGTKQDLRYFFLEGLSGG